MALGTIGLEAVLDMKQFNRSAKSYDSALGDLNKETGKTASGMSKALSGLGKVGSVAMKGMAVVGGLGVGALTAAGGAIVKMALDAKDIPNISAAFKGLGGSIEAMREGSLGMVTDVELMKSFNSAAQLVSQDFAQKLPNAMGYLSKVSAATGQDMGFMIDSLVKGVGRLSPMILDNLGIQVNLTEANEAYAASLGKSAADLTKAEQQTAIMNMVMEKLAVNTAAMPEVAGTAAQSMAALQTTLANTKDQIGTAFIPVLQALLTPLAQLAQQYGPMLVAWAQSAATWITTALVPAISMLFKSFSDFVSGFQAGANLFQSVAWGIGAVLDNFIPEAVMERVWDFLEAFESLGSGGMQLSGQIQQAFGLIQTVFQSIAEEAAPVLTQAFEHIQMVVGDVVAFVGPLIQQMAAFFTEQFGVVVSWVQENMPLIQATVSAVFEAISAALDVLSKIWIAVWPIMQKVVETAWAAIATIIETVIGLVLGIIKTAMLAITGDWEGAWSNLKETLLKAGEGILEYFATFISGIIGIVSGAGDDFLQVGREMMDGFIKGIKERAKAALDAATGVIKDAISGAKKLLGIGSPSKVFADIGRDTSSGFVMGIEEGTQGIGHALEAVTRSMVDMANSITYEQAKQFEKVSDAIEDLASAFLMFGDVSIKLPQIEDVTAWADQFVAIGTVLIEAVNRMGYTEGTIRKAKSNAVRIGEMLRSMIVDLTPVKIYALPDLKAWAAQIKDVALSIIRVVSEVKDFLGTSRAVDLYADLADKLNKILSLKDIDFSAMTVAAELPDLAVWSDQVVDVGKTIALTIIELDAQLGGTALAAAASMASSASTIMGFVSSATGAIKALVEYSEAETGPLTSKMDNLADNILEIVRSLIGLSEDMDQDATDAAAKMFGAAQTVIGFVGPAVGGISALADYGMTETRKTARDMENLSSNVWEIVQSLVTLSQDMDLKGTQAAATMLQAAQTVVGFVGPAVQALNSMGDYVAVGARRTILVMENLTENVSEIVRSLIGLSEGLDVDATEAAGKILASAQSIVSFVGPAIQALASLGDYEAANVQQTVTAMKNLRANAASIVGELTRMSNFLDVDGTARAAAISQSASTIVAFVGPAIQALANLADFYLEDSRLTAMKMENLRFNILEVIQELDGMARELEQEAIERSAKILQAANTIVGFIKPAIDALAALASYIAGNAWTLRIRMVDLRSEIRLVLDEMDILAGVLELDGVTAAAAIFQAAQPIVAFVKDALDLLTKLGAYKGTDVAKGITLFKTNMDKVRAMLVIEAKAMEDNEPFAKRFGQSAAAVVNAVSYGLSALLGSGLFGPVAIESAGLGAAIRKALDEAMAALKSYFTEVPPEVTNSAFHYGYVIGRSLQAGILGGMGDMPTVTPVAAPTRSRADSSSTPGGPEVNVNMGGVTVSDNSQVGMLAQLVRKEIVTALRERT